MGKLLVSAKKGKVIIYDKWLSFGLDNPDTPTTQITEEKRSDTVDQKAV